MSFRFSGLSVLVAEKFLELLLVLFPLLFPDYTKVKNPKILC